MSDPRTPEDLRNSNGNIDARTALTGPQAGSRPALNVSGSRCREIRRRLLMGATLQKLADDCELHFTTVQRHATGNCSHDHGDPPALRHTTHGPSGEWVERE